VKLITHLHLVPMLRMRGAILPLLLYVFTAWAFIKNRYNFNYHLRLGIPNGLFPSGFRLKHSVHFVSLPCVLHPALLLIHLNLITVTLCGEEYKLRSSSFCVFLSPLSIPRLRSKCLIFSILFPKPLRLCSSSWVINQVLHPYKTKDFFYI